MQEVELGILPPVATSGVESTVAIVINNLIGKQFQLNKGFIDWMLTTVGNTPKASAGVVGAVEVLEENSGQTGLLFTAEQIEVLRELSGALENQDGFSVALAKLKSFADLKSDFQPSIAIALLLARVYQRGHSTLLKADPVQALSYFKTVCLFSRYSKDPFVTGCQAFALDQIKAAAEKEGRPGAILFLVDYYFRRNDFQIMDRWAALMPKAYEPNLEKWYHENQVHLKRVELNLNVTNIAEIVQELCSSLLENADDPNRQAYVIAELVRRAELIKNDYLCAVPLLKTLKAMIRDQRFEDALIGQLLDALELRFFFKPSSESQYSLQLAQVYLVIVGSDEKSNEKLKELLEANDDACRTALERLHHELMPPFVRGHPDFQERFSDLYESLHRPSSGLQ